MSSNNYDREKILVDALISRDEGAYRYIIEKYREPLIRLCRGFTGSFEDAEDLAQDIFIEIFRSVDKFKSHSSLSTWIYRIAVNKSLNFLRDRKKKDCTLCSGICLTLRVRYMAGITGIR
ncbi:MAG: RNA polymerase sigma factor [Bacteroidales bacterium]|nr:RNA polymerase sigma factor [Bacteroidales bacterium]